MSVVKQPLSKECLHSFTFRTTLILLGFNKGVNSLCNAISVDGYCYNRSLIFAGLPDWGPGTQTIVIPFHCVSHSLLVLVLAWDIWFQSFCSHGWHYHDWEGELKFSCCNLGLRCQQFLCYRPVTYQRKPEGKFCEGELCITCLWVCSYF